jgi:hypothetical protein
VNKEIAALVQQGVAVALATVGPLVKASLIRKCLETEDPLGEHAYNHLEVVVKRITELILQKPNTREATLVLYRA